MRSVVSCFSVAALLCSVTVPANAAVLTYDMTGDFTAHFSIDTSTAYHQVGDNGSGVVYFAISGLFGGLSYDNVDIGFPSDAVAGGLEGSINFTDYIPAVGRDFFFSAYGQQLYAGTAEDPKLLTGVFDLPDYFLPNTSYHIVVTSDAVPEPAAWALMLAGFGLAGAALRRRQPAPRVT